MPLKTLVKVGNITNLSDARYCAGMGVDFLGFCVVQGQPSHIAINTFQEIRGWVNGPKIVAEMYGCSETVNVGEIISNYVPDFIECSLPEFKLLQGKTSLPFLIYLDNEAPFTQSIAGIEYFIIPQRLAHLAEKLNRPVFIIPESKNDLERLMSFSNVKGFVLKGSAEQRPGFKDYDMLAEVLEALDE